MPGTRPGMTDESPDAFSQKPVRPHDRAPHVRRRTAVEAEAFLGLAEVAADDVGELLELDLDVGVEGVEVVHADHARRHVPFVVPRALVFRLDVGLDPVVRTEILHVHLGVGVAHRLVGEEAQRLVHAHRPAHLLVDVGLDQLRAPIAVVGADEAGHADVVQQAGEHHLLAHAVLARELGALEQVLGGGEAAFEEVDQGRLVGHRRQPRVGTHQHVFGGIFLLQPRAALHLDLAVGEIEQHRLGDDALELLGHALLKLVGAFGQGRCGVRSHGMLRIGCSRQAIARGRLVNAGPPARCVGGDNPGLRSARKFGMMPQLTIDYLDTAGAGDENMRRSGFAPLTSIFVCAITLASAAHAQAPKTVAPPAKSAKAPAAVRAPAKAAKTPKAVPAPAAREEPAPYSLGFDKTITLHADRTAVSVGTTRIKILGESALPTAGQQSISYVEGMQTLEIVEAYTEKADGRRIAVDPASSMTRDEASGRNAVYLRDGEARVVIFPDLAVGDSIVLSTRSEIRDGVFPDQYFYSVVFPRQVAFKDST